MTKTTAKMEYRTPLSEAVWSEIACMICQSAITDTSLESLTEDEPLNW